jgi:hypothetical protein
MTVIDCALGGRRVSLVILAVDLVERLRPARAQLGIAPPRWFHHRLMSAVPSRDGCCLSADVPGPLSFTAS